jgi:hypothetical protein
MHDVTPNFQRLSSGQYFISVCGKVLLLLKHVVDDRRDYQLYPSTKSSFDADGRFFRCCPLHLYEIISSTWPRQRDCFADVT